MELTEYLDAALKRQKFHSDSALADALSISRGNVSRYRSGYSKPDDDTMRVLARLAGVDVRAALLDLNTWRTTGETRKTYEAMRKAVTAAFVVAGFAFGVEALNAHPSSASVSPDTTKPGAIYIMRQHLLRMWRKTWGLFRPAFSYA